MSRKLKLWALVAAALLPATDALALALGRVRGAALIGRPVNLVVPVTLEAGEQEPCVAADVYQGESRMGGITVRLETPPSGALVRVLSSTVLEEPTLTLYLRVGCGQQVTRRFVLLAEYPDQNASAPVAPPARAAVPAPSTAASVAVAPSAPAPAAATPPVRAERPARAPAPAPAARATPSAPPAAAAAPPPERSPRARPERRSSKKEQAAAALQSHLKVDLLDLSVDASPVLRSTPMLQSQEGNAARRAEAAALWQALNMPPEQLIRQSQRVDAMEREVKQLRDTVRQNNTAMGTVAEQLQKARAERNWITMIVIVLAALLVAAVAGLLWRKRPARAFDAEPADRRWWQRPQQPAADGPDSSFAPAPAPLAAAVPGPVVARDEDVDLDLSGYDQLPDEAAPRKPAPPQRVQHSDFMASQPASMRMVKAEELIDIQQQAEFFISIGQTDQALSVLEAHVHDHVETSPIAWLDLLELYHALGRTDDYGRIREEFMASFNVQVPDFAGYRTEARGLEDYKRALSRIVALWPSPRVMEMIEESLFRKPGPGAEAFDVEAYRDLLLLYNIAKDLAHEGPATADVPIDDDDAYEARTGFHSTDISPLSAMLAEPSRPGALNSIPFDMPPAAEHLDVDIDLESLSPPEPEPLEMPPLNFDLGEFPPHRRG